MARRFDGLLAGVLLSTGIVIMGCDDRPRSEAERPRIEAQANTKVKPTEGPVVSKPNVSEPVEPKSQTKPDTEATSPSWKPGDRVRVRPDLRRSDETDAPQPKPEEKK